MLASTFINLRRVLALGLLIALVLAGRWLFLPRLARGVTKSGLLALRPGMTEGEVVRLIGEPLFKERTYRPRPAGEKSSWEEDWSWSYGEQALFDFGLGFEISVNFHRGHMTHAAAERFDLGVWWCTSKNCPVVWDKDEFDRLPSP